MTKSGIAVIIALILHYTFITAGVYTKAVLYIHNLFPESLTMLGYPTTNDDIPKIIWALLVCCTLNFIVLAVPTVSLYRDTETSDYAYTYGVNAFFITSMVYFSIMLTFTIKYVLYFWGVLF